MHDDARRCTTTHIENDEETDEKQSEFQDFDASGFDFRFGS
jgi:hypothetical protein